MTYSHHVMPFYKNKNNPPPMNAITGELFSHDYAESRGLEVSWFILSRSCTRRPALPSLAHSSVIPAAIVSVNREHYSCPQKGVSPNWNSSPFHWSAARPLTPTVLCRPCHLERSIWRWFTFLGSTEQPLGKWNRDVQFARLNEFVLKN